MRTHSLAFFLVAGIAAGGCETIGSTPDMAGGRVFRVEDFGAVGDGIADDGPAIRAAVEAARVAGPGSRVELEPKTYRLLPLEPGAFCIPTYGQDRFTLDGRGAHFVVGDPKAGVLLMVASRDSVARGFSIEYDPLPYTAGTVTAVNAAENSFDLRLLDGYPSLEEEYFHTADNRWGMVFDPVRRHPKPDVPDHVFIERWTRVDGPDRTFRMTAVENHRGAVGMMEPGDRFVHLARHNPAAALLWIECRGCTLEDVTVYNGPGGAAVLARCDAMTVRRFQVRHKPGSDRLLTTNADGVHCHANATGPRVEDCYFEGMADDMLNVYTPPGVVLKVNSPTEIVVPLVTGLQEGHRLQILDSSTGRVRGTVRAESFKPAAEGGFAITLSEPVADMRAGTDYTNADTVFNLDQSGEGYVIRNNVLREFRGRGMLLQGGRGLVEGNRMEGFCGLGIAITHSPGWPEGPVPRDITIRGNTITGVAYTEGSGSRHGAAIQVLGKKYPYRKADAREIHGIRIENNTIRRWRGSAIAVCSARDVTLRDNFLIDEVPLGKVEAPPVGVHLENCEDIRIEGLRIRATRPEFAGAVRIGPDVDRDSVRVSDVEFVESTGPIYAEEESAK